MRAFIFAAEEKRARGAGDRQDASRGERKNKKGPI